MRVYAQVLVAMLLAVPAAAEDMRPPVTFEDAGFGFAVDFPAGKVTTSTMPVPKGFAGKVFQIVKGPVERFGVSVVRYPKEIERATAKRRTYIDDVRDKLVRKLKGTIVLERGVTVGDHAGREFSVRTTNFEDHVGLAVLYTQRVFLVRDRYFSVFTVSRFPNNRHKAFLASFRLTDDPGAPDEVRFEGEWQRHEDGMRYFARLPAEHLREGPETKSRAVELDEEASGLAMASAWEMKNSPLLYGVSTLRLPRGVITAANAEAMMNAMRLQTLEELDLEDMEQQIAIESATRRVLSINGTKKDESGTFSVKAQLHLTGDGFYEVVVMGPTSAMKGPEAKAFLERFKPAKAD
jgi:hypothetical protein